MFPRIVAVFHRMRFFTAPRLWRFPATILGGICLVYSLMFVISRLSVWQPLVFDIPRGTHNVYVSSVFIGALNIGAVAYTVTAWALYKKARDDFSAAQTLGAVLLLIASVLMWVTSLVAIVPVLVGFVLVAMLTRRTGRRAFMESSGTPRGMVVSVCAVSMGAISSLIWPHVGTRLFGAVIFLTVLWIIRCDPDRRITEKTKNSDRLCAFALSAAYFWLEVLGITWIIVGPITTVRMHEFAVHTVFVGCGVSLVMGYAAAGLSKIFGVAIVYKPIQWVPLIVMHLGVSYVVMGDVTDSSPLWMVGNVIIGTAITVYVVITVWNAFTHQRLTVKDIRGV